ncbi:hypothetical protein [Massilia sp. METH4]|uniref:hypothetical protein n=1 Tax=Massilia sp. METH4 TaxID=3123041 RepID=UPI0030D394E3
MKQETAMFQKSRVLVPVEGRAPLPAWLYLADKGGNRAAISIAYDPATGSEGEVAFFAAAFAFSGYSVLTHAHREGDATIAGGGKHSECVLLDWQCGVTFLRRLPGVDTPRIGIWNQGPAGYGRRMQTQDCLLAVFDEAPSRIYRPNAADVMQVRGYAALSWFAHHIPDYQA